jgi:hypothetical protein
MNRYRDWALSVLCWDGILPLVLLVLPVNLMRLFPQQATVQLISAVGAPIVAFLLRLVIGNQRFLHFDHFRWQRYVFWVAICSVENLSVV